MKLTTKQIKQIIKEELDSVLSEGPLDKFLRRRKIKKQGGYEWDDFSPEQKDSLRRAMDSEDPDMTKADLEYSKKQTREKVQTDLEDFKNQRDAKKKAEEARRKEEERKAYEARRRTQERVELLQGLLSDHGYDLVGLIFLAVLVVGGGFTVSAIYDAEEKKYQDTIRKQRKLKRGRHLDRIAWEERVGSIAIEVEKMSKEEIYEKIKNIKPKHGKPIPKLHIKALAEQISEMSVTEVEQVLKDEWVMKKAFKRFEVDPTKDLKIKKDDSIYK